MKEIIYLDTDIMNSMLAQLDEGLVNSFSLEQQIQESETEGQQSTIGKNAGLRGSLNMDTGFFPGGGLRLDASMGNKGDQSANESRTILESQKDVLNKAFHDHALEVLTNKLVEEDLLSHGDELKEGDLYLGEANYRFYDFDLIKKSMNADVMKTLMLSGIDQFGLSLEEAKQLINKKNPNAKEREKKEIASLVLNIHNQFKPTFDLFNQLNVLSTFASNLLGNLTVIKTDNKIGLLKKSYLRESAEALSFRTDKSRKVKFLVRVIGLKETVYRENNFPVLNENDIDMVPNMMLDIILGSFKIINQGDLMVTPIAVYYE